MRQLNELNDVIDASLIFEPQGQLVKDAIGLLELESLIPAFLELQKIRRFVNQELPLVDRLQPYEDLARKLWKSYKVMMVDAAAQIGANIGFLFQKSDAFEAGLKNFVEQNSRIRPVFKDYVRDQRCLWQEQLADFRNRFLEHRSAEREEFGYFYKPENAELLFEMVWRAIVNILAFLLEMNLPEGVALIEQDPNDPAPKWPNRFRYDVSGKAFLPGRTTGI